MKTEYTNNFNSAVAYLDKTNVPECMGDAAVYVADTLELSVKIAQMVYGAYKEETILAIYDRLHSRRKELIDMGK